MANEAETHPAERLEPAVLTSEDLDTNDQASLIPAKAVEAPIPATTAESTAIHAANTNPLAMLSQAIERGVDIEKLDKLMDMADRYEANQARKSFAAALSDFQGKVPAIVENKMATVTMQSGGSYTYNYADLDVIMKAIRPTLNECGLSVRYDADVSEDGKRIRSTCYVMHRDGHTEKTTFTVPVDEAMKVNDSQKMGSANAYACRYNVVNALGLTTGEDDDAGSLHGDRRDEGKNMNSGAAPPKPKGADALETTCPIGKHKGQPWDQVPLDYLEWMVSNLTDKDDIVERAKRAMNDRLDSQDQKPQQDAEASEPTMADCARNITQAKRHGDLVELWAIVPEKHKDGLRGFYETRKRELSTGAADSTDDGNPF